MRENKLQKNQLCKKYLFGVEVVGIGMGQSGRYRTYGSMACIHDYCLAHLNAKRSFGGIRCPSEAGGEER